MDKNTVLSLIEKIAEEKLSADSSGHGYDHVRRVSRLAGFLAKRNGADEFIARAAGFLHDYCRPDELEKGFPHYGAEAIAIIRSRLAPLPLGDEDKEAILLSISEHENYPHNGDPSASTLEGKILQDADRLDAIGAIGVARNFMFTAVVKGKMFDPSADRANTGCDTAIAYFYTMMLPLAEHLYTEDAKRLAEGRIRFLEGFLKEFYDEWFLEDLS